MAIGLIIRDATDTPRTVSAWLVRDGGSVPRTIAAGFDRDVANVSQLFYNPSGSLSLAVTAIPIGVGGHSAGSGTATTGATTATATGGTAPYTYAWTLGGYDGPVPPTATNPANASTAFTQTGLSPDSFYTSDWTVTATDALANTAMFGVTAGFTDIS